MVEKNWLEWSVFSVSLVVLAFIFGFLGYDALTSEGEQPDISVQLGTVEPHGDYFIVPLTFRNDGGQSVEDVQVDVTLMAGGAELEVSSVTAPALPRQSSRQAWVVFSNDPAGADAIEARLVSYVVP